MSQLVENGASSTFSDSLATLGGSIKTLYWGSDFIPPLPWDSTYKRIVPGVNTEHNVSAKIAHVPYSATENWYWNEDTYAFEPYNNKSWVYSNKMSIYHRSTSVMGTGVMPPLKVQDTLTGLEPSYDGEPITGNLLLWTDNEESVSQKTSGIQLGGSLSQEPQNLLHLNQISFDVLFY